MPQTLFDPSTVNFDAFFDTGVQIGGGAETIFYGLPWQRGYGRAVQQGAGFGDVLRGLWRYLIPFARSAGKAMGEEGLKTGSRILQGLSEGRPVSSTVRNETSTGLASLTDRAIKNLRGEGRKRATKKRRVIQDEFHRVIQPAKRGRVRSVIPAIVARRQADIFD